MIYEFSHKLRIQRATANLTQQQVADYLGYTVNTISQYENGASRPSYETIAKLAVLYHTTADYLLGVDERNCITFTYLTDDQLKHIKYMIAQFEAHNKSQPAVSGAKEP